MKLKEFLQVADNKQKITIEYNGEEVFNNTITTTQGKTRESISKYLEMQVVDVFALNHNYLYIEIKGE